jgi:hypothetical protein
MLTALLSRITGTKTGVSLGANMTSTNITIVSCTAETDSEAWTRPHRKAVLPIERTYLL